MAVNEQSNSILKVRNLQKKFGSFNAVSSLTFDVAQNEIVGLLGPNGAGKTTTLRMLSGLLSPTEGDISIANLSLIDHSIAARRLMGYLPENVPLYSDMTVEEFIDFVAQVKGIRKADRKKELERVGEFLSLQSHFNQLIGILSKGYRQRVGLAQAILGSPKLILLDEPTSGLDPEQTVHIRNLISELKKESSLILSSHLLSEVERVSDRVLIMDRGSIVASGSPKDLNGRIDVKRKYRLCVRGDKDKVLQVLASIKGIDVYEEGRVVEEGLIFRFSIDRSLDITTELVEKLIAKDTTITQLIEEELKLEDIFLKLVQAGEKSSV